MQLARILAYYFLHNFSRIRLQRFGQCLLSYLQLSELTTSVNDAKSRSAGVTMWSVVVFFR